jgi:hypothetical protein
VDTIILKIEEIEVDTIILEDRIETIKLEIEREEEKKKEKKDRRER